MWILSLDNEKISSIYGIKYGSEILSLDASDNNDAFAVGAYNGGLWSLQKRLKRHGNANQDDDKEEQEMFSFKRI